MQKQPLTSSRECRIVLQPTVQIAGRDFECKKLPAQWHLNETVGVLADLNADVRRIHIDDFVCHPRAIWGSNGEILLFHAAGPMHYAWAEKKCKGNSMYLRRSTDHGKTWSDPVEPWVVPYSQHAVIPFQPSNSHHLYAFGTEPMLTSDYDGVENAAIGYRTSSDSGLTWSEVTLIRPENAPLFRGMSAMRMCETADGVWLLGSHAGEWSGEGSARKVQTQQFMLRGTENGKRWELQPGAWPNGWFVPSYERMDEGRPIHLGHNKVLFMVRTPTGYLWELRSDDGGKTWTDPTPTTLAHPDAPPMLFYLSNGKTLAAFHHNKNLPGHMSQTNRTELWVSLSEDDGRTWEEPRFLMANAADPATLTGWGGSTPMVSYADLLTDGESLHLFIDHQMRQILHVRLSEKALRNLPRRSEILAY